MKTVDRKHTRADGIRFVPVAEYDREDHCYSSAGFRDCREMFQEHFLEKAFRLPNNEPAIFSNQKKLQFFRIRKNCVQKSQVSSPVVPW